MKKFLAAATFLILVFFMCGFSPTGRLTLTFDDDGKETVLSYDIPLSATARRVLFYGGSYKRLFEKRFSGDLNAFFGYLNSNLPSDLEILARQGETAPCEPTVLFDNGVFSYTAGIDGRKTDTEKLKSSVLSALDEGSVITVPRQVAPPLHTEEELRENTVLLSVFSTYYGDSGEGRKHNIALAARKLSSIAIPPSGLLCFNEAVGKRTAENGFREANVISDGEFVTGIGGGVCQVSTTLYDAWLTAGKAVPFAANHSLRVKYVLPALDAMVSDGTDLVLLNDGRYPAYVHAEADGKSITVSVFGEPQKYTVKLRSEVIETIPAVYAKTYADPPDGWGENESFRIIKKGRDGLVAEGYRDFYSDGKPIKSERLRRCRYAPTNGELLLKSGI